MVEWLDWTMVALVKLGGVIWLVDKVAESAVKAFARPKVVTFLPPKPFLRPDDQDPPDCVTWSHREW